MATLYAALDDRLLVVTSGRGGWTATERLVGHEIECVGASPDAPERVFAGTVASGLERSTDGGETWGTVGSFENRITAITVSPHDPADVWIGTEPSAVFRSRDGGETFQRSAELTDLPGSEQWSFPPRPYTHHVRWLTVNPHDPAHVYVATEAGAFVRSTDGGETWRPHPEGARRDNHTLATHPDAPCRVYAAAGDGYAESRDCGDTWTYPQAGLDHRYVWGLAVDPGDPDTVVVSAASGASRAHRPDTAESYVYRRSGGGWGLAMDGLPPARGTVRAVLSTGDAGEFYALTNRGLFRSADGALSWRRLPVEWCDAYRQRRGQGLAVT